MLSKKTGASGESYACELLVKNGYEIIQKNFSCKLGEIDIICIKDDTLVFVEVKTRRSNRFGFPFEAVTQYKIKKIEKVGEYFSLLNKDLPKKRRIDVVSILVLENAVAEAKIIPAV